MSKWKHVAEKMKGQCIDSLNIHHHTKQPLHLRWTWFL